jgi:hypothetical protein
MGGVVDTNIIQPANLPGLAFTLAEENWTIAFGILVASQQNVGVFSDKFSSLLTNNGSIFGFGAAVSFEGNLPVS